MLDVWRWLGVEGVGFGSRVRLKISRNFGRWGRADCGGDLGRARLVDHFHLRPDGSMGLFGFGAKLLKGLREIVVTGFLGE